MNVGLFPVRHHSPRVSAALVEFLEARRPEVILVEGPADATPLIPVLVDAETRPPVALLAYRTDGTGGVALWPMAEYSPEHVALCWAAANGARAAFCDVTSGQSLATTREDPPELDEERLDEACARALGRRSFAELWESEIEAPAYREDDLRRVLLAYAELVRDRGGRAMSRARDAVMWQAVEAEVARGTPPEAICVVAGAAHVAAFAAGDVDVGLLRLVTKSVPTACTVIPFSYPRLAEQIGYGAGNRAPHFYQRAWAAHCDYQRATLETLSEIAAHLRVRGFAASLADVIEAYGLARRLAELRGKAAPGVDELREAATATLGRGDERVVNELVWRAAIGRSVGQVARSAGRNSLEEEFWREVSARRLPADDELAEIALHLGDDAATGTSVFLHRLRVADVPYAGFVGASRTRAGGEAGGVAGLGRLREAWEARWTPATQVALVERIIQGETLRAVAARELAGQLTAASTTGAAADVLGDAVLCDLAEVAAAALTACEARAAVDDDLPSLARACRALGHLAAYGGGRGGTDEPVVSRLLAELFTRATLRLGDALTGADEGVAAAKEATRMLHELALAGGAVDRAGFAAALGAVAGSFAVNPGAAGLAVGLLHLAGAMAEEDVVAAVALRLSGGFAPADAAGFIGGLLEVNALVLVRSRLLVGALDAFMAGLPAERFREILPVLRRAFAALGPSERRYLLEHIARVGRAAAPEAAAAGGDLAAAAEQAMGDLEDLL